MHIRLPKYRIFLQTKKKNSLTGNVALLMEVLPYERPENNFVVSGAIHCENAI